MSLKTRKTEHPTIIGGANHNSRRKKYQTGNKSASLADMMKGNISEVDFKGKPGESEQRFEKRVEIKKNYFFYWKRK